MNRVLTRILRAVQRRLLPAHYSDALAGISPDAMKWDIAAVQLQDNTPQIIAHRYPQYLYGLLCAARTAKATGVDRFTAVEFGVAGGNGLLAMERHARVVTSLWDVNIDIVGFDMSTGLPPRDEPRDCPFAFGGGAGGEFSMDEQKLREKLQFAQLCLGDVAQTVTDFVKTDFAPIGFVSNDLDLYSSTRDSFDLFSLDAARYLPRIPMYFDDLIGYPYTSENAEFAAIAEYNRTNEQRKIGLSYGLNHCLGPMHRFAPWPEKMFILELFDHAQFNEPEKTAVPNLALKAGT